MKTGFTFIFLAFWFCSFAQISANYGTPKFSPEDGKKLLIVGQDLGAVGGLDNYSDGYVDNVECHLPAGVTSYTSLPSLNGLTNLANWGSGDVRAQAYLEDLTFSNTFIVIGLYVSGSLNGIADGFFNSSIRTFANWVKDQNRPVFIRIGYEFEGPWNNHNPTQYKNAWRQIVHIFDEEEVHNAAYVWQSAGLNYSNISNWYPGDEYVNWVGYSHFDGFNMGQSIRDFAEEHDKPIMIAEATPRVDLKIGDGEMHWLNWYLPLFESIYANDRIKALAYINVNWDEQPMWAGQGWGDSRVQVNDFVKETWENEIKKDPWITASSNLLDEINYEEWVATDVQDVEQPQEAMLLVQYTTPYLQISHKQQELMASINIWDYNGQLLYSNTNEAYQYTTNLPTQIAAKGIIIEALDSNNTRIVLKSIITPTH